MNRWESKGFRFFKQVIVGSFLVQMSCAMTANIGVIDISAVMKAPKLVALQERVAEKLKPESEALYQLQMELAASKNDLEKNSPIMDVESRKKAVQKIEQSEKTIKARFEKLKQAAEKTNGRIQQSLTDIFAKVAKEQNLDIIHHGDGVLYAKSNLDVTKAVLNGLKKSNLQ